MRRAVACTLLAILGSVAVAPTAPAEPLRRGLSSYFVLAQRKASLKNLSLDASCNVGVNCPSPDPQSACGVLALGAATLVRGSQTAADKTYFRKPGAVAAQVFRNAGGPLANLTMAGAPEPFATPILPGTCDADCHMDALALETVCGFPSPFPECDPTANVLAVPGADCTPDAVPGNGACDLPPGTYGYVIAQNTARLNLTSGLYVTCGVRLGRHVVATARGTTIFIADGGFFKANGGTSVAQACGDLTVMLKGRGNVGFGRHASIAAEICAPESSMRLGHGNQLVGRFVGDIVSADSNNHARCCVAGACACFDDFAPRAVKPGDVVTLVSHCGLVNTSAVRVCGHLADIVEVAETELKLTVPAAALGSCPVEIDSPTGTFEGASPLEVS